MEFLLRAGFFVLAAPAILRATARLAILERRLPLEELTARLRATRPFRLALLRRPAWLLASLDRMLPLLPPWRYGRCLERSLLLLDLWSRCGLQPSLHLGVRSAGEGHHQGHAWVTTGSATGHCGGPGGGSRLATASQGYAEAFEL